jgi:NADP-dependent 3-hydroxy acid dehydrogenase YdfG
VDVLIHSAGTIAQGPLHSAAISDFDAQYRANVRAPYLLTQTFLSMLKVRPGQVVFINSTVGLRARADVGQFAATQHALKAIADSLRDEVNGDGVRVLSVFPGRTATPRQEKLFRLEGRPYRPEILLQPEDVATVVINALTMPRTAEITEISLRPLVKSY